jgi:tRNA (pseudouridine54-N1)-methyltransferase
MREFVYFSRKAVTTGNFTDLMDAGRMDIVAHIVIHSFFVSNAIRDDVTLHLFFYGQPDPPKHLELHVTPDNNVISKKDVIGLIKRMLYKHKAGKRIEAFPGCFIEKKSILQYLKECEAAGRNLYLLDPKGEDLRTVEIGEHPIFFLGDHDGFGKDELRRLKKAATSASLGKKTYFASQTMAVVQYELDRRGL